MEGLPQASLKPTVDPAIFINACLPGWVFRQDRLKTFSVLGHNLSPFSHPVVFDQHQRGTLTSAVTRHVSLDSCRAAGFTSVQENCPRKAPKQKYHSRPCCLDWPRMSGDAAFTVAFIEGGRRLRMSRVPPMCRNNLLGPFRGTERIDGRMKWRPRCVRS